MMLTKTFQDLQRAIEEEREYYTSRLIKLEKENDELKQQIPKTGRWTKIPYTLPCMNCPICGNTFTLIQGGDKMHYCPNCGSKMAETQTH